MPWHQPVAGKFPSKHVYHDHIAVLKENVGTPCGCTNPNVPCLSTMPVPCTMLFRPFYLSCEAQFTK